MFTKKDRKIANQKAMIDNRNKFIAKQEDKITTLETALRTIISTTEMNRYGYPEVYLRKINELAKTAINN